MPSEQVMSDDFLRESELARLEQVERDVSSSEMSDLVTIHICELAMLVREVRQHRVSKLTADERMGLIFVADMVEREAQEGRRVTPSRLKLEAGLAAIHRLLASQEGK
jgi:hypothetical protein